MGNEKMGCRLSPEVRKMWYGGSGEPPACRERGSTRKEEGCAQERGGGGTTTLGGQQTALEAAAEVGLPMWGKWK